jgi:hypothetical protein
VDRCRRGVYDGGRGARRKEEAKEEEKIYKLID